MTATAPTDNPYEDAARLAKATLLADVLAAAGADPDRVTAEQWGLAQTIARVPPASERTRRLTRDLLRRRQAMADPRTLPWSVT